VLKEAYLLVDFERSGPHPYYMKRGDLTLDLPNPHKQDIGIDLAKEGKSGINAEKRGDIISLKTDSW
jgi:hypothetical protein